MATQRDLSLAYSPGVAVPVLAIAEDESKAYDYTTKGNFVAVITNGTAILGLGNRGALAAKPVMEGKAVLFKRFADIDSIDLEVYSEDPDEIINCVKLLGKGWGGINLEDIKAPECFIIEQRLRELLDIPVFHDDQHGTAIISAAGLLNSLDLTGRKMEDTKLVCNGAGAAGIACLELLRSIGFRPENLILCDTKGVIYEGRTDGMNQWKSAYAVKTKARTLADALKGADVFFGLSAKGAVTKDMVASMAPKPIIFAMANPDPEITVEEVAEVRDDAIMATGRSDYPNQVNNVLGFPYIFRGALDVRATTINMEMKIAAARALAELAREDVPDEVAAAYGARPKFGPDYIIPVPFDPRLISHVPPAVAKAAMDTGVARKPIADMEAYRHSAALAARSGRGRAAAGVRAAAPLAQARGVRRGRGGAGDPRRGELRARGARHRAAGRPRGADPPERAKNLGIELGGGIEIINAALSTAQLQLRRLSLRAAAAPGLPAPRLPAPGQPGPQHLRRLHGGARRRRRHGDRRHPQLLGRAGGRAPRDRSQARPPRHRAVAGAVARPHRAGRRHRDHRDAATPRTLPTSRSRPPASPAAWATSRGSRCWRSRPSAIRPASARRMSSRR